MESVFKMLSYVPSYIYVFTAIAVGLGGYMMYQQLNNQEFNSSPKPDRSDKSASRRKAKSKRTVTPMKVDKKEPQDKVQIDQNDEVQVDQNKVDKESEDKVQVDQNDATENKAERILINDKSSTPTITIDKNFTPSQLVDEPETANKGKVDRTEQPMSNEIDEIRPAASVKESNKRINSNHLQIIF